MANKLPWFTHDHDAHQDLALRAAVRRHGHAAGWIYWCTLELLHKHGVGDTLVMSLADMAASMMVDKRTCVSAYKTLCELGLITEASYEHKPYIECKVVVKKFRERQAKLKIKTPSTLPQDSAKTPLEGEREEKTIAPEAPAKAVAVVSKVPTPIQRVVGAYKIAKGVDRDDKAWDKSNFGRYSKAAKDILGVFGGSVEKAVAYVILRGGKFKEAGLDWTLETVARHAHDNGGQFNDGRPQAEMDADSVLQSERTRRPALPGKTIQSAGAILANGVLPQLRAPDDGTQATPFLAREDEFGGEDSEASVF